MGSTENKVPNIDIDVSKSALKSKPIDKDAPYISADFEITGKVQGNKQSRDFMYLTSPSRSLL